VPHAPRIPSYRYHKASRQAVVVLDGRSHYLGAWDTTESRAEYDRLIAEYLAGRRRRTLAGPGRPGPAPSDLTVNELILAFLDHAVVHYRAPDGRPTRHLDNLKDALRPARALFGPTLARDFGPLALRAAREEMVRAGICRRTINDRVHRIRRCFRWAASVELIPVDVVLALETVEALRPGRSAARESPGVRPVPPEHVEAVLPRLAAPIAAMVKLQLLCGCRAGEVVNLRGADLDTTGPIWTFKPPNHKNAWRGEERVVYLGPNCQAIIKEFLKPDPAARLFSPRERVEAARAERAAARRTKRTPSELGRCRKPDPRRAPREFYDRRAYRQAIVRACRQAGIPPWSPGQLRHLVATTIRKRFGVEGAQLVLGHRRADVTQLYAQRDEARARAIAAEVG
jgi:integrase